MKKHFVLAMAFASIVSQSNNPNILNHNKINVEPQYKRKKCKSCYFYSRGTCWSDGYKNPNHQACKLYKKRK